MKRKSLWMAGLALGLGTATAAAAADGISYQRAADMLYRVMSADREVYTRVVVQRLTVDEKIITEPPRVSRRQFGLSHAAISRFSLAA